MFAPIALAVAALIAGHPMKVACDVPAGSATAGRTLKGGDTIHVQQAVCDTLASGRATSRGFPHALHVLIHESVHGRGVKSEPCAELEAVTEPVFFLEAFYGVRLGDPLALNIVRTIMAESARLPASYQPQACASSDLGP